jgi:hypothetical protein
VERDSILDAAGTLVAPSPDGAPADAGLYILRIWLPDRPGALGQVASRVGAVRGDVVAIDILERDGGQAIDELVVELPVGTPLGLLVNEVSQVDGVRVEEVRPAHAGYDPRLDALEAVAQLTGAADVVSLGDAVVSQACRVIKGEWAALIDGHPDGHEVVARHGEAPSGPWLRAFVAGSTSASSMCSGDVAWAPVPSSDLALVVGRPNLPFRAREIRHLAALARVAGTRRRELSRLESLRAHPSVSPRPVP